MSRDPTTRLQEHPVQKIPMAMKMMLIAAALALSGALAAPSLVTPAKAQRLNSGRERAITECIALQGSDPHEFYGAMAGNHHHYRACMADHGQPE